MKTMNVEQMQQVNGGCDGDEGVWAYAGLVGFVMCAGCAPAMILAGACFGKSLVSYYRCLF